MGQFVIEAENDAERAVLRQFVNADPKTWKFWLHGSGGTLRNPYVGPDSFNFGWIKPMTRRERLAWKWQRFKHEHWYKYVNAIRVGIRAARDNS